MQEQKWTRSESRLVKCIKKIMDSMNGIDLGRENEKRKFQKLNENGDWIWNKGKSPSETERE